MLYFGVKDGRKFFTEANGKDAAYLNIGEKMTGKRQDDAGNVDLDKLIAVPKHLKEGEVFEVPE